MSEGDLDTVLLVCGHETDASNLVRKLHDAGIGVVGPVPTAGLAMTLASQSLSTIAVVATRPEGRRDALALGRDLMSLWGIRSWVFDEALESAGIEIQEPWVASGERIARLREALKDRPVTTEAVCH